MADDTHKHPEKAQLLAFGMGKLKGEDAEKIAQHLDGCQDCSETMLNLPDDTFVSLVRGSPAPNSMHEAELGVAENQAAPHDVTVDIGSSLSGDDKSATTDLPAELRDHPRYEIMELIGRGGMGDVYKAQHKVMNRVVALKVIKPELVKNEAAVECFRREVQAAASLRHPNIVTAFDAEQAGNLHFLVMEYVDGDNLHDVVARQGSLSANNACDYIRQVVEGLQHAHDLGIVHRDIKPQNLMVTADSTVKILDFGLATLSPDAVVSGNATSATSDLTATSSIMGTPDFIAPEQAVDAHQADIRSDIYSLGATLYYLLSGQAPFAEGSVMCKLKCHAEVDPQPIENVQVDVPAELAEVIQRMMAKNPQERFQTPEEVAEVLAPLVDRYRNTPSTKEPKTLAEPRCQPPRPWIKLALGALAIILAGVIFIVTDTGTLVIQSDDENVEITVRPLTHDSNEGNKHSEAMYRIGDTVTGSSVTRLRSGAYIVDLKGRENEYELSQERFVLKRGGKVVLTVTRRDDNKVTREEATPDVRNFNRIVPVPTGVTLTELQEFAAKKGAHYKVTVDPVGQSILTVAAHDDAARLWSITGGGEIGIFPGVFGAAAFSPNGKWLFAGTHHPQGSPQNQLVVWDIERREKRQTFPASTGVFTDVDVSPDGRWVASSHGQWWGEFHTRDNTIRIWDLESSKLLHEIRDEGNPAQIDSVAFTPDGEMLVSSGGDGTVRLWDVKAGTVIREFHGTGTRAFAAKVSPDGRHVLAGFGPHEQEGVSEFDIDDPEHCIAILWNLETGDEVQRFVGHHGAITDVGFSPDGTLVVTASGSAYVGEVRPGETNYRTSDDKTMRIWSAETGEQLAVVLHRTTVASVDFSPDGRYLVSGETQLFHVWRAPPSVESAESATDQSERQLLISSNRGGDFDIYLIGEYGTGWHNLTAHPAEDTGPAWSPDGSQIAFCSNRSGNLDVWVMNADGSEPRPLTRYGGIDRTPCWSPDGGRIAFVRHLPDDNWEVFVIDADGSNEVNLSEHPNREADPAWSPDGTRIAFNFHTDTGARLHLMDPDGSNQRMVAARSGSFMYPAWSPDGRSIVYTAWVPRVGDELELFMVRADGSHERQLTELGGLNTFAAFSSDGERIAFQHRKPNKPGVKAIVHVMNADGTDLRPITGSEAHIGYGGGRPAWRPRQFIQEAKAHQHAEKTDGQ